MSCDRVVIIAGGTVLASEELAVLLRGEESSFAIVFDPKTPFAETTVADARILHVSEPRTRVVLRVRPDLIADIVRTLANRYRVTAVEPTRSTLGEIYRERVVEERP